MTLYDLLSVMFPIENIKVLRGYEKLFEGEVMDLMKKLEKGEITHLEYVMRSSHIQCIYTLFSRVPVTVIVLEQEDK